MTSTLQHGTGPAASAAGPRPPGHTSLYRFFDADGALLYIGITNCLPRRFERHEGEKPWFAHVARVTVEHHPDRDAALVAERIAIQQEKPRYNVVHNRGRANGRRAIKPTKGTGRWYFESRRSGYARTVDLRLYPELDCSSMVDDYYDYDGDEQLDEYVAYIKRKYPAWLENDAVPIVWTVLSGWDSGVFENAPFQNLATAYAADSRGVPSAFNALRQDFLTHFTWPYDPRTGERLDWYRLPVVNDRFPEFAKALAWTPSPLQPNCPLRSILQNRAGYRAAQ